MANDNEEQEKKKPKSQTIFIHKLYHMLEDEEIKHLIWWSTNSDSFYLVPGEEFCKVLLKYFKHSNVASFVRQLNMYGFHKVSDNSSEPVESNKWEFVHSSGMFRKGDFDGLRNIKRRSSRKGVKEEDDNKDNDGSKNEDTDSKTDKLGSSSKGVIIGSSSLSQKQSLQNKQGQSSQQTQGQSQISTTEAKELMSQIFAMKEENTKLQKNYAIAVEDLRRTNLDMVNLIDIIQKNSPAVESELRHLKNGILQRCSRTAELSEYSASRPLNGSEYSISFPSQSQVLPGQHQSPHVQSFLQQPSYYSSLSMSPSSHAESSMHTPFQYPVQKHPLLNDMMFSSSNKNRAMSVLCDPLAPGPAPQTPQHIQQQQQPTTQAQPSQHHSRLSVARAPSLDSLSMPSSFSSAASYNPNSGRYPSISSVRTVDTLPSISHDLDYYHKRHSSSDLASKVSHSTIMLPMQNENIERKGKSDFVYAMLNHEEENDKPNAKKARLA